MQVTQVLSSCQTIASTLITPLTPFRYAPLLLAMAFIIKLVFSWLKTYQVLTSYHQQQLPHPYRLTNVITKISLHPQHVHLIHSPRPFAQTIGFWSPTIVLSTALIKRLTKAELESVMWHESYHVHFRHPFLSVMADNLTQIFFFFPSLIDTASHLKTLLEHQADCFAARQQQTTHHLQGALVKLITQPQPGMIDYPGFAAIALSARIDALKSHHLQVRYSSKRGIITLVMFLTVLGLSLTYHRFATYTHASTSAIATCSFANCVSRCLQEEFMSKSPLLTPVDKLSSSYYTL